MEAIVKTNFEFEGQKSHYVGKVRDVYSINDDYLVMVVSDRISAFDVVLPKGIPFKGQVLNQIAAKFLSKVHPSIISLPAFLTSAVSSTITGGLPAPAPIAFFPLESTLFTTPGPPVQTRSLTAGCLYIISAVSSVGFTTDATSTSGPPTALLARLIRSTA